MLTAKDEKDSLHVRLLKKYWGYEGFRGIQQQIISSISSGHDTLGLMPTGGGKSITFQVPALAQEGTCIVITPLIALMKDQVQHLRRRGIKAAAIYSGMQRQEALTILENAVFGQLKLLYVSPERLSSEFFRIKLRHIKVSFITVDEAHCISQWGYDFRPSYLHIADIRRELPGVPVLALTATATPQVIDDMIDKLAVPQPCAAAAGSQPADRGFRVFRMSFERKNLAYVVRQAGDKREELLHILNNVPGSAIVYVRSRQHTKETAQMLAASGISATFYHAGLDNATKDERQKAWQADQIRVMVATNAFGMGIDKPDVRLVLHTDCPDSIEAYFQEAGRAGRDGQKAYAVLLCNNSDQTKLQKRMGDTFPEKEYVRQVYDHLTYYYQIAVGSGYGRTFEFNVDDFCQKFRHFPVRVLSALKILTRAGYVEYIEEQECRARVMFTLERDDLYQLNNRTDAEEERIITALLRTYSGLFVDFQFIDEAGVGQQAGLTRPQVYLALKRMASKGILRFIPQKRTPYLHYLQRREESEHLMLPPHVYEDLKVRYQERLNAMAGYMQADSQCRSRYLLRYFGETGVADCGQCDVCLEARRQLTGKDRRNAAAQQIMGMLADGQRHHITQLHSLALPYEQVDVALQYLFDEEYVYQEEGFLVVGKNAWKETPGAAPDGQ